MHGLTGQWPNHPECRPLPHIYNHLTCDSLETVTKLDHQTHDALKEYMSQVRPIQSKYLHARPSPSDITKINTLELRLKYQEL